MRRDFLAESASEAEVAACVRKVLAGSGYLVEPHTACGVHACERALQGEDRSVPQVVLATAHPAKFPDAMEAITGVRPGLPKRLHSLMSDPERFTVLDNDAAVIEAYVEDNARAIGAGQ